MPKPFHIVTVANDLAQYEVMRQSFASAGFTDEIARYTLHDNSVAVVAEPYGVLRQLDATGDEPYVIFCHQDVRSDLGPTADDLLARLEELTRQRPDWAVAGNAGTTAFCRLVMHLDEPGGRRRAKNLPVAARSLDENFLVFRRGAGPMASDGLSGFHFYGTDACLRAIARGRGAYVIDFLLTHLSGGNPTSADFFAAERRLVDAWRPRVLVGLIGTTCTELRFSRWRWLERILHGRHAVRVMRRIGLTLVFAPGRRDR